MTRIEIENISDSIDLQVGTLSSEVNMQVQDPDNLVSFGSTDNVVVRTERDYRKLLNKPQINSVVLDENVSLESLGLRGIYYDTTAAWNMMPDMIAKEGYIYVYKDYQTITDELGNVTYIPGIRIGDGKAYLKDLPFLSEAVATALHDHINDTTVHVTALEKAFWNNKVTSYIDPNDPEGLVLTKNFVFG